jgi:hypothetical protein
MLGLLGQQFMGQRMFAVMKTEGTEGKKVDYVTLDQYLIYNDKVYHGTGEEKNEINFKMLDLKGTKQVSYEEFHEFWFNMITMFKQLL